MLNVRKLAAIDLVFLGPKIILAEFALGVIGPEFLGFLTLRSAIQHGHSARQEIAAELEDKPAAMRKYRRQSLFLLLPFVVPILAIVQQLQRKR